MPFNVKIAEAPISPGSNRRADRLTLIGTNCRTKGIYVWRNDRAVQTLVAQFNGRMLVMTSLPGKPERRNAGARRRNRVARELSNPIRGERKIDLTY